MKQHIFKYSLPFKLESGEELPELEIAYTTLGQLNSEKSNVVWVCHALTGNAEAKSWWPGLIGEEKLFDPAEYFIICANVIGSCYGSTGPLSINPSTREPYYHTFPSITIRDIVASLDLLRKELDLEKIYTCIGGSLGGQQALEWAILQPDLIENLVLMASNAQHLPWVTAFNEAQRMAIKADSSWRESHAKAGIEGMKAARAIALLSYRNFDTFQQTQAEDDLEKTENYKVASYQQHQGQKLADRFNAFTYYTLTKIMDSHNVGRGRRSVEAALQQVKASTLVIGISSDLLFPVAEQKYIARFIPGAVYHEIDSLYGHDGFLVENDKITAAIEKAFYANEIINNLR